ncbi:MAG: amidase [Rhodospirillaceae bacterium]|nr:amidase [Rhodospirillaceae bacterium]|tara:strand:+ start:42197 stop:43477 length:1281 start_codon:yes stop_codon:yes gene_type:complete
MLNELSFAEAVAKIERGDITSERLVRDCLDRIEAREDDVRAWAFIDPELALSQARACDSADERKGPLHGVPFGVKDIIATYDMPTGMGSPIYEGNMPGYDAACVALLRAAGAVILGKTVTVEFAGMAPPPTGNPHNLECTPGGSSSGSGAAVADFMVPAAFGTQTAGSIHRPAAHCGIIGFKPTFDSYSLHGVWPAAQSLDTLGLLTRAMDDIELLSAALLGRPVQLNRSGVSSPRIAICKTHQWDIVKPETEEAIAIARDTLNKAGAEIIELTLPKSFEELVSARDIISSYERARATSHEWFNHRDQLSPQLQRGIAKGFGWQYEQYTAAMKIGADCRRKLDILFEDFDAIIAPCTAGEAPPDRNSTGDHTHIGMWNLLHVPSYALPTHKGPNNMPVAIQLIGRHGADDALFDFAKWVLNQLVPA